MGTFTNTNIFDVCDDYSTQQSRSPMRRTWLGHHRAQIQRGAIGSIEGWPCGADEALTAWLNHKTVREAIRVPGVEFYNRSWEAVRDLPDEGLYSCFNGYDPTDWDDKNFSLCGVADFRPLYAELSGQVRCLIYNGDLDPMVPYTGTEAWTRGLGFPVKTDWEPWRAKGRTTAGYVTVYDHGPAGARTGFTWTTVRGAGHLAPLNQPQATLTMISRWLLDQPLHGTDSEVAESALI
jgi:serine carboxypeptidase-like clade 1